MRLGGYANAVAFFSKSVALRQRFLKVRGSGAALSRNNTRFSELSDGKELWEPTCSVYNRERVENLLCAALSVCLPSFPRRDGVAVRHARLCLYWFESGVDVSGA